MQIIKLSEQDIDYLGDQYPELVYSEKKNTIEGILHFDLKYEKVEEPAIKDRYEIVIQLDQVSEEGLPKVYETGGRILAIANNKKIHWIDLHLNNSRGEMCIIIPPKVKERYPDGFDLREYLHHVEEHLYYISYFEKYNKEPWPQYGHAESGYVQLYVEDRDRYGDEVKKYFNYLPKAMFDRKIKKLRKKYGI